jgi:competence protein ComEC
MFHRIPFGSILANFLAIPFSSVLIGLGSICWLAPWLPGIASAIHALLSAFLGGTAFFSGRWLTVVPTPSLWVVACFYVSLVLLLACKNRPARISSILACALCIVAVLYPVKERHKDFFRVHFIDVGQGDAILLEYPDGTYDLVDAGGFWNQEAFDVGQSLLLPYLSHLKVTRLHRVFLTHAHADHMGGLFTLLKYIPVKEFFVTRQPLAEPGYQRVVRERNLPLKGICKGKEFRQGNVRICILAPEDSRKTLTVRNDDSMVLLVECRGKRLLLSGDAEKTTEEKLAAMKDLKADFLKAPHHGSKTSSHETFLEQIKMKIVFVSVGANNWFGHPHPEVLRRYRRHHALVYRTDQLGTIRLTVTPEGASEIDSYSWSH